ncbi:MAG: hypothetical protein QXD69_01480, partial [Candidatus Bathyarchaeia archaeon]
SPRIAPYTSVATWYRFLIGAAPIASTLAGVGIVKTINNRMFHILFIIFLMLLALPYTYGVDETSKFISALREFPKGMTPSPMESRLLNDLIELTNWFKNQELNSTVVAQSFVARWVHLAIRNPTPEKLVWTRVSPISTEYCLNILDNLNLDRFYLVYDYSLEANYLKIEKIREGFYKVYLIEKYK